jgi:hypothetical protein
MKTGLLSENLQLGLLESTPHRHRSIVLYHRVEAKDPAQEPDPQVGKNVAVQIVHHYPEAAHPAHFPEKGDRFRVLEVMEEEGSVRHVECIVRIGEV